eukprot:TRINITY_DN1779_c1_g3_i1.p1 TRINITY_DN1779_c1_g3~~TRINITY_DN1779_c1_g3_i1.p1  ORF type:complete len:558 (+),score=138.89 TRINITY_DN1779_c1_g3_i1:138-1811(+)
MGCGASSEEPPQAQRCLSIQRMNAKWEEEGKLTVTSGGNDGSDLFGRQDSFSRPMSPTASSNVHSSKLYKKGLKHDLTVVLQSDDVKPEEKRAVFMRVYDRIDRRGDEHINVRWLQDVFNGLGLRSSSQHVRGLFEMQTLDWGSEWGSEGESEWSSSHTSSTSAAFNISIPRSVFITVMSKTPPSHLLDRKSMDPEDEIILDDDNASQHSCREPPTRHWTPGTRPLRSYTLECYASLPRRVKALAPRHPILVTCSKGESVLHLIDTRTSDIKRSFQGHCDAVFDVCISPNKQYVATVSRDTTLIIWEATCGVLVKQYAHPAAATAVIFLSNAEVLTGCSDSRIRRFSIHKGLMDASRPPPSRQDGGGPRPVVVALAKCGKIIAATRLSETSVELLDYNLRRIAVLTDHATLVWMLDVRQDGQNLLSVCERKLQIWDTGVLQKRAGRNEFLNATKGGVDPAARLRLRHIPLDGLQRHGEKGGQVMCWQAARWLPATLDHYIIASSSDHAVRVLDMQGQQLLLLYQRFPIYCISAAAPEEEGPVFLGDVAGNILAFTPS